MEEEIIDNPKNEQNGFVDSVKNLYSYRNKLHKLPASARNRRYKKLQELIKEDEFFSEESIQFREPTLHFLYVGRYKRGGASDANITLNEFLINQCLKNDYNDIINEYALNQQIDKDILKEENISSQDLEDNEDELINIMHYRFLCGEDTKYFDYSQIDNDVELDDLEEINKDQQDKFFDEEEESDPNAFVHNTYTGIQDF